MSLLKADDGWVTILNEGLLVTDRFRKPLMFR